MRLQLPVSITDIAAACSVLCVFVSYITDGELRGWVSALGAALVFGMSSLPAKHPAASAVSQRLPRVEK